MTIIECIFLCLICLVIGVVFGWFFTALAFSKDKRYVLLKEHDVILHRYDLEILVASAPRHVKRRLIEERAGKIKEIAEQELKEEE